MPGPERAASSSGRAAHQRRGRDHAERRRDEDQRRRRVRQLQHDRDRDERDEQVRPAGPAQQEPAQVEPAVRAPPAVTTAQPLSRRMHLRQRLPRTFVDVPPALRTSEYLEVPARRAAATGRTEPPESGAAGAEAEAAELTEQVAERLRVGRLGDLLVLVEVGDRDVERDVPLVLLAVVLDAEVHDHPAQDLVVLAGVDLHARVLDRLGHLPLLLLGQLLRHLAGAAEAERGCLLERVVDVVEQLRDVDAARDLDRVVVADLRLTRVLRVRRATCAGPSERREALLLLEPFCACSSRP